MSPCIKDLFDYGLVKKCCVCGIISLKSNFHKDKKSKDGLFHQCRSCVIKKQKLYDSENRERIINGNKEYYLKNRNQIMAQKKI